MCVPPSSSPKDNTEAEQAKLDSLRQLKCPRFMSSAAEYYRNRNWRETVEMYSQIIEWGCDEYDPVPVPGVPLLVQKIANVRVHDFTGPGEFLKFALRPVHRILHLHRIFHDAPNLNFFSGWGKAFPIRAIRWRIDLVQPSKSAMERLSPGSCIRQSES